MLVSVLVTNGGSESPEEESLGSQSQAMAASAAGSELGKLCACAHDTIL